MIDLLVTRHQGLVEYCAAEGIITADTKVVPHATPDLIRGKHVLGVLPHSLSCLCETFSEIPLSLPPELRGKELSVAQVRQYAGKLVTYTVTITGQ